MPAEQQRSQQPDKSPIVIIPECEACQLVGEDVIHLAAGELHLHDVPSLGYNRLTLTIGPKTAFSLDPALTTFFTHIKNPRWYFFSLPLATVSPRSSLDEERPNPFPNTTSTSLQATKPSVPKRHIENIGSGSYIRLTLPEDLLDARPGTSLEKFRDRFEDALISRGYLRGEKAAPSSEETGGRIRRETTGSAIQSTRAGISQYIDNTAPSTQSPTQFSPTTHSFVDTGATTAHAPASYANRAAQAFAHMSISVGERVTTLFGIRTGNGEKEGVSADSVSNKSSGTSRDRTPRASMTTGGGDVGPDPFNVTTTDEADWGSESDVNESAEDIDNTKTAGTGSESVTERTKHREGLGTAGGVRSSDAPVARTTSEGSPPIRVKPETL